MAARLKSIPVVRLEPGNQWDCHLLDSLLANELYPTGLEFDQADGYPDTEGCVLLVPGRYWHDRIDEINKAIARYDWILLIRTSDEQDLFDISRINHQNVRFWVQTPRADRGYGDARLFGVGYPPHFNRMTPPPKERIDVFLSAQNTHSRRAEAFAVLGSNNGTRCIEETNGFTQGLPPIAYRHLMSSAKVAPAPSGAFSPDSFRLYEALEAHAVPIADDISPAYDSAGYWRMLYPDAPFPILANYSDLPGYIEDALADYPRNTNRITAWWMLQKHRLTDWLRDDLTALSAPVTDDRSPITAVITCSPIKSHPATDIIEETIASVRAQLPDSEIVLVHDGVRPEQENRRTDYETYMQRVLWKSDHEWGNILPLVFDEHLHQAVCTKRALEHVRTPLILFVEADTPLTDGEIPWDDISDTILHGDANMVRLHHEASILEPHKYLMLDQEPLKVRGVPMQRTIQWSQRPHLASTAWYRDLLDRWFPNDEPNFVEDVVYSRLIAAHERDGDMGWLGWRTFIYTPDGDIKRSYHTDGREGEEKFV